MAAKSKGENQGRRREVAGICLLGFGIFCVLSLISMQAGSNRMMGPGGAATAAGLYSLAGLGAYVVVFSMLAVAIRCFRGGSLVQGFTEGFGMAGLLSSMTVLLHLPFADQRVTLRGPGGLLGQWLGEITASFIGGVGAALAAATLLTISLLVLTNIQVAEVVAVVGWATGHLGRGLAAAGRTLGRMVVAMFPERDEAEAASRRAEAEDEAEAEQARAERDAADEDGREDASDDEDRILISAPAPARPLTAVESEAVRVGKPSALSEELDSDEPEGRPAAEPTRAGREELSPEEEERRAMSSIVAEMAAIDYAAEPKVEAPEVEEPIEAAPVVIHAPSAEPASGLSPTEAAALDRAIAEGAAAGIGEPARAAAGEDEPLIVESPFLRSRPKPPRAEKERKSDDGPGYIRLSEGDFRLPSADLLSFVPQQTTETDKQALLERAARLEEALATFGVKGKVREIHVGPVVTMFEVMPADGVRAARFLQLENDLAMKLEAQAVRIVAPIPGKPVVGVEVPNRNRETVYLREILEDDSFRGAASKLQVALGKDIKGAPVSVNLAKMPHLLVAGTTGSGKSVAINTMITSVLYNATPEEARFIMIDPKRLELSIYEGIPHLLLPVVTDPQKANLALRWAVDEMERRYELLATMNVRDVASYNARVDAKLAEKRRGAAVADALEETPSKRARRLKVLITGEDGVEREVEVDAEESAVRADAAAAPPPDAELAEAESDAAARASEEPPLRKLPYIVIVIDEFADLMMVAPKDVETSVARIAQKARAAGLHLIVATQRPSVDVITGLIKANFPSRIALQVASKIDSRTVLDQPGAETLLGNGDMLFSNHGAKLKRIHGAFLATEEVERVAEFLKTQAKPVYDMDILKPRDEEGGEEAEADDYHDDFYDKAVEIVCQARQASTSYIQRRLAIGYNRAARMIEQMERDGIVSPPNSLGRREILAPPGDYAAAAP